MTDADDRPAQTILPTDLRGESEPAPKQTLRQRAEQIACDTAAQSPEALAALSPQDLQRTVHELRVHQIELQMQNEELRRAQAEITVAHARYFDLYELAPVGYCTLCKRGLIREANLTAATLLGLVRSALTGQPMVRFILREDQDVFYRFRKTLFEAHAGSAADAGLAGGPHVCTLRMCKPDGAIVWAQFAAIVVTEADGSPVCRVTISDLTLSKAVDALRDNEEGLTLALDAAQLGIYDWDIAANRILWSQQHERLWGFAPGGFDGTYEGFLSRVHPDDVSGVTGEIARCMTARDRFSHSFRVIWPDGSLHWMQGLGEFSVDTTGKPQRMRGVVMEITARKEEEQALRRFQQIVETSREMVMFIDRDLRYQVVNPAYAALFPARPQALQGCRVSEVVGADGYARIAPELQAALAGETRRFGFQITALDGRGLDLEATCSPFREGGSVQGIVVSLHDVTETQAALVALDAERAQLEDLVAQRTAALQASEGMLRTIHDLLPVGISITDRSGRIVDCNQTAERLLDLTREEHPQRHYVGKDWAIIRADGTPLPADAHACVRAMVEQRPVREVEMGIVKPAGITWLSVSATPTAHADYGVVIAYVDITERRQGAAALRASEQRWQFALEGAGDGVWDWDIPSGRVFFSKGWKAMLGYGDEEIGERLGEWEERVHPEDLPRALADVQDHLDGTTPVYVNEHRIRCKDGSWKWILDRGQVMARGADGQPLRAIGVHTDISERKQTEAALRTGKQQLDMALQAAAMGIWDWEIATGRVAWAGEHAALFGVAIADFGGTIEDVQACVHPDDREQGMAVFRRTMEEGAEFDNTYRVVWPDGSLHWLHSLGKLTRDERGAPQRIVGTTQDITERHAADRALRDSEQRFRAIIDSSPVPFALNDAQRNITYLNLAFIKLFGYTLADIPTLADWWPLAYPDPDYRQRVMDTWQERVAQARQDGERFAAMPEVTIRCKNGQDRTHLIGATALGSAFDDLLSTSTETFVKRLAVKI